MTDSHDGKGATGHNDLLLGAADLGAAVERHALILTEAPEDYKRVTAAVNELRASALAYAALCADLAGWGNPLGDLENEPAPGEEEEEEDSGDTEHSPVVHLEAHYRIRVPDVEAAERLLGETSSDDLLGAPSDVVAQLFMRDGWDPYQYGGALQTEEVSWTCGPDAS
ncbi:hypothetical protein Nocox_39920 [Nonomuraea coxensis DSM 45129]|uniref:Uncharacterized protein n=1 Tax=Nonomuraea coxensis DSM 45129 TaxID=1122611 RepID=A0ABX8UCK8_9ACTN|nr:hypothetical protein [Nonomuraea coxensis]QYC45527.1 hypothetical protein Nocox_39920 [Nonomuraea coxensis DSM 45129]